MNYIDNVRSQLRRELDASGHTIDNELLDLYTLLTLTVGVDCQLSDVHDAWAIWRNRTNSEHKSLIPFDQLDQDVQDLDRPYMNAIIEVADSL